MQTAQGGAAAEAPRRRGGDSHMRIVQGPGQARGSEAPRRRGAPFGPRPGSASRCASANPEGGGGVGSRAGTGCPEDGGGAGRPPGDAPCRFFCLYEGNAGSESVARASPRPANVRRRLVAPRLAQRGVEPRRILASRSPPACSAAVAALSNSRWSSSICGGGGGGTGGASEPESGGVSRARARALLR